MILSRTDSDVICQCVYIKDSGILFVSEFTVNMDSETVATVYNRDRDF